MGTVGFPSRLAVSSPGLSHITAHKCMVSHAAHHLIAKLLIADGVDGVGIVDPSGVEVSESD